MSATGLLLFIIAIWVIINAGHLVSLMQNNLTFNYVPNDAGSTPTPTGGGGGSLIQ
jgi:hypothetical protein